MNHARDAIAAVVTATRRAPAIAVASGVVLALLLAISVLIVNQIHRQVSTRMAAGCSASAAVAIEHVGRILDDSRRSLWAIAAWLRVNPTADPHNNVELSELAESLNIDTRQTGALAVIDASGQAVLLRSDLRHQPVDVSQRPYFSVARDSDIGEFSYGPPLTNANTGEVTLAVMLKTIRRGRVEILATAFAVEPLVRVLSQITVGSGGFSMVLTRDAQPPASSVMAAAGREIAPAEIRNTVGALQSGTDGTPMDVTLGGLPYVVCYRPISRSPFLAVIGFPGSDITAEWLRLVRPTAALLLPTFVLLVGLALVTLFLFGRLTRDQERLATSTKQLALANERYALAGAHAGIWDWNMSANTTWLSPRVSEMLGYSVAEFEKLSRKSLLYLVHPDDRPNYLHRLRQHLEHPETHYLSEHRLRAKDGSYRWFLLRGQSELDARGQAVRLAGLIADVHDRKVAEAALYEAQERLRAVMDNTLDGLITLDDRGTIVSFSKPAAQIFGYQAPEIIGRNIDVLVPEADPSSGRTITDSLRAGEAGLYRSGREVHGVRKDGSTFPMDLAIAEIPIGGAQKLFVATVRDITQRRQTEEQLQQAQKMQAVGQLTGGIAHDFNNLLAVVIGNLELLIERLAEQPDTIRMAETALRSASRGADLTGKLLAFSRRQALQPQATDVNKLIEGLTDLLARTLGEPITVRIALNPHIPPAFADPAQLESALLNLALNARDAMPQGGELTIETSQTTLDVDYVAAHPTVKAGPYVLIAVSDTGMGMNAETLARAFEPFFTTKDVGRGSGLGLSMVYGFVQQSGGHIAIYSEEGRGTSVKIYLPPAPASAVAAGTGEPEGLRGNGERILVVEDDPDVRDLALRLLDNLGYVATSASDAAAALALIDRDSPFDLVLSDVVLPGGIDGYRLAEMVHERRPGLPVVFMSGYSEHAGLIRARNGNGAVHINKPFSKAALSQALRRAFAKTRSG